MKGYLGEFEPDWETCEFAGNLPRDWVIYWIESYGQIDSAHHKAWVLDQVMRILQGTPVIVKEARWENGEKEYRVSLGEPSQQYKTWLNTMNTESYYDSGIAP